MTLPIPQAIPVLIFIFAKASGRVKAGKQNPDTKKAVHECHPCTAYFTHIRSGQITREDTVSFYGNYCASFILAKQSEQ
ncbi:hypothetical protein D7Y41_08865 [Anaerotruncus sp. 1XD22-93]|nr:hypothetical protein D7Y41_08865 [Anaerotruncus sp. 1XD22-93]